MVEHRDKAALLAVAGGFALVLSHFLGGALNLPLLEEARRGAERYALAAVPPEYAGAIPLLFAVMLALTGLGGFVVIFGGLFYHRDRLRTGSLLVAIGAGTGLLGPLLLLVVGAYAGQLGEVLAWAAGPPGVAVVLLVAARRQARKARRARDPVPGPVEPEESPDARIAGTRARE